VRPSIVIRGDEHEGFEFGKISMDVKKFEPETEQMLKVPETGDLPYKMSFARIEPEELFLSAFKKSERSPGLILRLYNISLRKVKGKVSFKDSYNKIYRTNMNEEREQLLGSFTSEIELEVAANEVITLELLR